MSFPDSDSTASVVPSPITSSVTILPECQADSQVWTNLLPIWPNSRGLDRTVTWTKQENALVEVVAKALLPHHQHWSSSSSFQVEFLAQCMRTFMSLISADQYKARLVASRGWPATKCPQWHVDHVPIRWIQALQGPSCQWIAANHHVHWDRINALELDNIMSVQKRNQRLVSGPVQQAAPGTAVVLVGNAWPDHHRLAPVVHKSPDPLLPWEGRVLLTMDGLC